MSTVALVQDLSVGTDVRGDLALFIESKHFTEDSWHVDEAAAEAARAFSQRPESQSSGVSVQFNDDGTMTVVKRVAGDCSVFFRVLHNGRQQHGHGWLKGNAVEQWG